MAARPTTLALSRCLRTRSFPRQLPVFPDGGRWSSSQSSGSPSSPPTPPLHSTQPTSETPTRSKSQFTAADEAAKYEPPPYLPRPLGMQEPPRTRELTNEEKRQALLDPDKRKEERKHILKEIEKGYYHDFTTLRQNGSKLWTGPPTLIREDRSLYFPDIQGISLATKTNTHTTDLFRNKVSLVTFESTKMAESHSKSYHEELIEVLDGQEPDFQVVRPRKPLKSWLVSLFLSGLRKSIPASQHPTYLLSHQDLQYVREPMAMANKLLGYAYLVDQDCKIRWAGCGFATADERGALAVGTRVLLERLKAVRGVVLEICSAIPRI